MQFKQYLILIFIFSSISFVGAQYNAQDTVKKAYLIFTDSEQNLLYELDLSFSPQWIVRWNHSVTGVTVSDYYYWDGQDIILTDSHTPAFDAGLGHIPGRGKQLSDSQNGYFIIDIDEKVPNNTYAMRVGSLKVNHRIIQAGRTYSLSDLAERKRIVISVRTK